MRLVGRPRRPHVDEWVAGERRGEGEGKVHHACACEVWIRMGTVERINVGEKGGKSRITERNWISTDGTNGARTRAIGLVRNTETVIIVCRSHMCCMTKGKTVTRGGAQ